MGLIHIYDYTSEMNKQHNSKKWLVIELQRIFVKYIGHCAIIKANAVREIRLTNGKLISELASKYVDEDTQNFIIPEETIDLQAITYYAQNPIPWQPDLADYYDDFVFDQLSGKDIRAYIHRSYDEINGKDFHSNLVNESTDEIDEIIDSIAKWQEEHPHDNRRNEDDLPF